MHLSFSIHLLSNTTIYHVPVLIQPLCTHPTYSFYQCMHHSSLASNSPIHHPSIYSFVIFIICSYIVDNIYISQLFSFFVSTRVWARALHLLSRCSTTWATQLQLNCFHYYLSIIHFHHSSSYFLTLFCAHKQNINLSTAINTHY
jgi:hypothetical protein